MKFPTSRFSVAVAIMSLLFVARGEGQSTSQSKADDQSVHIQNIEATAADITMGEGQQPIRLTLPQLLEAFRVPGMSVAVIDNYKVVWAKGYGVSEAGSHTPVTTRTLFQAGSISKPVAATAALYLVENGKLSLDEDVNQKLKTWKVPENDFTKTQKVTLRRLMSHTAGLTVHGFPGYDVDAPLPSLVQIFNGEKPANTGPIRVDIVPGTKERYSGGGVTIEQQLMIDVTGKPFPALMRETVFDKIGMADSSYEQPLPATRAAMAAAGTETDGKPVHGKWHIYPEMAAAGLWTTPTDLSRFAIEIALSKQGKANHILSEKMTREMLTPVLERAGLGLFIDKENPGFFGHNGDDEGFQAMLTMNAETGKGIAIMANSEQGISAGLHVLNRVAKEYGWNYKSAGDEDLFLIALMRGSAAALQRYSDLKSSAGAGSHVNEFTLNYLGYQLMQAGKDRDAVAVMERNVQEYPQSANTYDSRGEAYAKVGKKDLAIQNYEKSLQLNPDNKNAVDRLKKLKENK
jgi:CubicO group peptidase (beta-lactamase class C family)